MIPLEKFFSWFCLVEAQTKLKLKSEQKIVEFLGDRIKRLQVRLCPLLPWRRGRHAGVDDARVVLVYCGATVATC